MKLARQITVCEVGLRDGMQIEPRILTVEEKLEMIHRLEDAGVTVIEVGSFMHPKAVPQMANTDEVFQTLEQKQGVEYRALVANRKGVERAIRCGCKKVKLNISARWPERAAVRLFPGPPATCPQRISCIWRSARAWRPGSI